jgi:hypothetical protein
MAKTQDEKIAEAVSKLTFEEVSKCRKWFDEYLESADEDLEAVKAETEKEKEKFMKENGYKRWADKKEKDTNDKLVTVEKGVPETERKKITKNLSLAKSNYAVVKNLHLLICHAFNAKKPENTDFYQPKN